MQSEQGNQESVPKAIEQILPQDLHQPIVPNPVPNPLEPALAPTAQNILKGMKDADNMLDFIRLNLKPTHADDTPLSPRAIIAEVEARRNGTDVTPTVTVSPTDEEIKYPTNADELLSPKVEGEQSPEAPVTESSDTPSPEEEIKEGEEEVLDSKAMNFSNIRKKLAETKRTLEEVTQKATVAEEKLKKYETGEELPDAFKAKELRISELEKYERLHALKLSPAYKEAFVKPIEDIKIKLRGFAEDYEIPGEVLEEALNLTNQKELNEFLAEHFDGVGALEVKKLVNDAQTIAQKAKEAEEEPARALQQIEQDYRIIQSEKEAHNKRSIAESSKEAWVKSLQAIRAEGKITELIHRENDTTYNKQRVEPILNAAASEYGKLIRMLVDNGLESLPEDVAFALARTIHLAHASAVSIEARKQAASEAAELKQNTERTTKYLRPPLGSSGSGVSSRVPGPQPQSVGQAADAILNNILSRRSS